MAADDEFRRPCCFGKVMHERPLDIRGLLCPMTWARVRRELMTMQPGERLVVVLDYRPAVSDIRRNSEELGHDVLSVSEAGEGQWRMVIEVGE